MMKNFKPQILSLSLILAGCSFPAYAQLLFSQYVDGTSNKKGLEIYNPVSDDGQLGRISDQAIRKWQ